MFNAEAAMQPFKSIFSKKKERLLSTKKKFDLSICLGVCSQNAYLLITRLQVFAVCENTTYFQDIPAELPYVRYGLVPSAETAATKAYYEKLVNGSENLNKLTVVFYSVFIISTVQFL